MAADVTDIRGSWPVCCVNCGSDKWKIFVDAGETRLVMIRKIRCTNCMFEVKVAMADGGNEGRGK